MFLRQTNREKDGKAHRYFSVVENRRLSSGQTVTRESFSFRVDRDKRKQAALELYDMRSDPGQLTDVAQKHPEVVERLKADYEKWWRMVSARGHEYARIILGDPKENPARLTAHDWHGEGASKTWNQRSILAGPDANGFWAVEVRPGRYLFEVRRWPKELDLPLGAAYRAAGSALLHEKC